eukprot:CAMPEP_0185788442 /NCGR_PEP_ID=MMETSP1174-20130828/146077_1 /TAXON_ID=35687 /ORGANISM="Dictyocha speculum, Strain CCMP1381" /LENGTH=43 /DNA_ID= /DNA_START= /DNA_END= /DNA_ORIENTATION=
MGELRFSHLVGEYGGTAERGRVLPRRLNGWSGYHNLIPISPQE